MKEYSKHLGYYIQEIARKTTIDLNEKMSQLNLSYAQFRVLNCLSKRGNLSQKEIVEDIVVKPSTLSGLLDLLIDKSYVEKRIAPYDGRIRLVGATDQGKDICEKAYKIVAGYEKNTTDHIPKNEKEMMLKYLNKMNQKI